MNSSTNMTHFTIRELLPSTQYTVKLAAVNNAGTGVFKNMTETTRPCNTNNLLMLRVLLFYLQLRSWLSLKILQFFL